MTRIRLALVSVLLAACTTSVVRQTDAGTGDDAPPAAPDTGSAADGPDTASRDAAAPDAGAPDLHPVDAGAADLRPADASATDLRPADAGALPTTAEGIRDFALERMRRSDLRPMWFTSGNWVNGGFGPWIDYLVGATTAAQYATARATNPSLFNDVYGLDQVPAKAASWAATGGSCYYDATFINPLAARFFFTEDARYSNKFQAIIRDLVVNERAKVPNATSCAPTSTGNSGGLLAVGSFLSGAFNALASMAKSADRSPVPSYGQWSTLAMQPVTAPITDSLRARFPAATLTDIARGVAASYSSDLLEYYEYAGKVPNQRMTGLAALAYLTVFFEPLPEVAAIIPRVDHGLGLAVQETTHLDGGQLEQSFNYDGVTVNDLRRLAGLDTWTPRGWRDAALAAARGYDRQTAALATPQGGLPQVGNMVWGSGALPGATKLGVTSIAFPYSGYYVQRSGWDASAAYLFFFYRRAARGHSMAGCNSLQIGAFGRQLIVAGGAPNYSGASTAYPQSPAYLDESSSFKTSTVVVDGKSQNGGSLQGLPLDSGGKPIITAVPTAPIASRWSTSSSFDFVEGLFGEGYKGTLPSSGDTTVTTGVTHWRGVVFVRDLTSWVVVDIMRSAGAHAYNQIWKLAAPGNGLAVAGFTRDQVTWSAAARRIDTVDSAGVNVTLRHFGTPALTYARYFGEGAYGYVGPSSSSTDPVPSNDIHARWSGTGNQVLITIVRPHPGLPDGIAAASDDSAGGVAGATLTIGTTKLSIRASAAGTTLSADGQSAGAANLLVVETAPGQPARTLVIGDSSYEQSGTTKTAIVIPSAFSWVTDAAGALLPRYQ